MNNQPVLRGVAVLSLLLSGCDQPTATRQMPADAVAMVGGEVITLGEYQKELNRRAALSPGNSVTPEEREAVLEELIGVEALYAKARAAGYERDPRIAASLKRLMVVTYQEDQLAGLESPQATPEEIAAYYQQHLEQFGSPAKVRAAIIKFEVSSRATGAKRSEIARRVAMVRDEAAMVAVPDGTFGLLAQERSEDQVSRYRGGDIGWFNVGQTNTGWPDPLMAALFRLGHAGEISPVIETPTAFYLVKLVEQRPATTRSLAEVRDGVSYLVTRAKAQHQREQLVTQAREKVPVQINRTLLEGVALPVKEPPPALPGVANFQPPKHR